MGCTRLSLGCRSLHAVPCTVGRRYVTSFISAGSPGFHRCPNSPPLQRAVKNSHKLNRWRAGGFGCLLPHCCRETKKYSLREQGRRPACWAVGWEMGCDMWSAHSRTGAPAKQDDISWPPWAWSDGRRSPHCRAGDRAVDVSTSLI